MNAWTAEEIKYRRMSESPVTALKPSRNDGPHEPRSTVAPGYGLGRETLFSMYADSWSDLPLLEAAGQAVAVNPDRRLDTVARLRHWPVIHLS